MRTGKKIGRAKLIDEFSKIFIALETKCDFMLTFTEHKAHRASETVGVCSTATRTGLLLKTCRFNYTSSVFHWSEIFDYLKYFPSKSLLKVNHTLSRYSTKYRVFNNISGMDILVPMVSWKHNLVTF
jgi:hypothetical protein